MKHINNDSPTCPECQKVLTEEKESLDRLIKDGFVFSEEKKVIDHLLWDMRQSGGDKMVGMHAISYEGNKRDGYNIEEVTEEKDTDLQGALNVPGAKVRVWTITLWFKDFFSGWTIACDGERCCTWLINFRSDET